MFESIRRAREVKKAHLEKEAAPDPLAHTPNTNRSDVDMGRRHFLRTMGQGIAATAVLSAVPAILQQDLAEAASLQGPEGIKQREKVLESMIASMSAAANSQDVKEALEGKGPTLLTRAFRAIRVPIDVKKIKGTKYDMSAQRSKHCIQLAYEKNPAGPNNIVRLIPGSHPDMFKRKSDSQVGKSNGIFWNTNNRFMSALHAFEYAYNQPVSDTPRDLMMRGTGTIRASDEQVVRDDPTLTNADIHSAYVCVEGIDPDQTSESDGFKSYPGVALRIGRGFAERVWKGSSPEYIERMSHSFMIALPPGEAEGATPNDYPARGMTGSPVWMMHNGERVCAGILHGVFSMPDPETGQIVNMGFFHGVEEMRAQQDVFMRSGA